MAKKKVSDTELCNHVYEKIKEEKNVEPKGYNSIYSMTEHYRCKECGDTKMDTRTEASRNEPMWLR